MDIIKLLVDVSYFVAIFLFIMGLKRMAHPKTAASGIKWGGAGMVLATLVTFAYPGVLDNMTNVALIIVAITLGTALAWTTGKKVAMTDMPQMIALYNGMGGGAAGAISAIELFKGGEHPPVIMVLAVLGGIIGTVSFSGSLIAWAKLDGRIKGVLRFKGLQAFNGLLFLATLAAGGYIAFAHGDATIVTAFFLLALFFGVMMTLPIGGADMPVVISLYNAFTGLAVAFEGFVLNNPAMIIAGTIVGSAGSLLTALMATAMNRSVANVLFSNFGEVSDGPAAEYDGEMKGIDVADAAIQMAYAEKVIIVPGYGMAVAQAQHKVWELVQVLRGKGVTVKFAIHPVAGRMPGHMNVLLAEAGVPYDIIYDLDEINNEFATADVAMVIGANDVVNPVAKDDPSSPIYGMPVLNVDEAKNVIIVKRGQGAGFSGIQNKLFFLDNSRMLYGDAQEVANQLIANAKEF